MTIRELFREFVVHKRRVEDERDRRIAQAWYGAAFARQQELPRLESVLTPKPIVRQTPQQLAGMARQLAEKFPGMRLRKRDPHDGARIIRPNAPPVTHGR